MRVVRFMVMTEDHKHSLFELSDLIYKEFSGEITPEEQSALDRWKDTSGENRRLYERISSEEVMREKIAAYRESDVQAAFGLFMERRERKRLRRIGVVRVMRYAAVVLLAVGLGWLYYSREEQVAPSLTVVELPGEMGRNMPVLTLSNGQKMVLYNQELALHEGNGVLITNMPGEGIRYNRQDSSGESMVYNTLTTPAQCDFTFTLADGTKVWMNAQSSLRYPVAFTGDERVVHAEGEVYLEVARDPEHPFFVVLNGMKVEVLGTSFNVNSYGDERFVEVTLVEGKVEAHIGNRKYGLSPDRQLRWDKEKHTVDIQTVNVDDFISWKSGQYVFKGKSLSDVAKVLERWYEVEIVFENEESADMIYTGVIHKEDSFGAFVQRLRETSPLTCRMEGNKLFIQYLKV